MEFWELSSSYTPPPAPPPEPAIKQKRGRPRKYKPSDMDALPKKEARPATDKAYATKWQLSHPEKMKGYKRAWRERNAELMRARARAQCELKLREKNGKATEDRQTEASETA